MNRWRTLFLIVILTPVLPACNGNDDPSKQSPGEERPRTENRGYDGTDPNDTKCSSRKLEKLGIVRTVAGSAVPIKLPDGRQWGRLVLRRSGKCQTIWASVRGLPPKPPKGDGFKYSLHLTAHRREDNTDAPFEVFNQDIRFSAWGDQLSFRPGCVSATGYYEIVYPGGSKGSTGNEAITRCSQ